MSVASHHSSGAGGRHLTPSGLPDSIGLVPPAKRYRDPAKSIVERLPNQLVVVHQHPGLMNEAHWHAQLEINFIFRGDVRYRMHGYDATLKQGELALFWGGLPHQMTDTSDDSEFIAIHLPLLHFFRMHPSGPDSEASSLHSHLLVPPSVPFSLSSPSAVSLLRPSIASL